jgi:hypothetical protein
MNGLGFRDWPDREVLKPGVKRALWIEFKRLGEHLTEGQLVMQHRLRMELGQRVVTCYTVEMAKHYYERHRA